MNPSTITQTRRPFQGRRPPARRAVRTLLAAVLLFGACATPAPSPVVPTDEPAVAGNPLGDDEISKINAMIFDRTQPAADPGEYLLGEGDLLEVSVFEAKELESTVRVSSRGIVTLPLIDTVAVKGLSAIEAEEKIESLYRERYIKNPHVTIFVKEHVSQRVTLVGQFRIPGTYDYPTKQRLLDVIALGGGLNDDAGQVVQVRRSRPVPGQPPVLLVDLDQLITKGNTQLNIEINGGDVLFIPEAGVFFVDGAVKRPGAYPIKHRTAVQEALVQAGGFEPWAVTDTVKLLRMTDTGGRDLIELDLKKPGVKEMALDDRDILMVDTSGASGFIRGFSISILGTGFSYNGR